MGIKFVDDFCVKFFVGDDFFFLDVIGFKVFVFVVVDKEEVND